MDEVKDRPGRTTRVSAKHQVTIPVAALRDAGVGVGDRLIATVDSPGRIVLERADDPVARWSGRLTGTWAPGDLGELRDEWR